MCKFSRHFRLEMSTFCNNEETKAGLLDVVIRTGAVGSAVDRQPSEALRLITQYPKVTALIAVLAHGRNDPFRQAPLLRNQRMQRQGRCTTVTAIRYGSESLADRVKTRRSRAAAQS
jgi:hypothetical protein